MEARRFSAYHLLLTAYALPLTALDNMTDSWLNKVNWAQDGLVPAVTQDVAGGRVLTLAWMNREALKRTVQTGEAHYWSRSRKKIWHKGEESGHVQKVCGIRLDCDEDVILLEVEQTGGIACHTGRHSCFFQKLVDGKWIASDPVLKDPQEIYKK
jgi:phosphoribosyl-AMP cyclohydrolase